MKRHLNSKKLFAGLIFASIVVSTCAAQGLKFINNPGGGQIVYGSLDAKPSPQDAMVFILHVVHGHYGDKPVLGKFFQDKSGQTVAVFFRVTGKMVEKGSYDGLVIVNADAGGKYSAAVLTDRSEHFGRSLNPMLNTLSKTWPGTGEARSNRAEAAEVVEPLHPVQFPDGSGTISLPDGWHITTAQGGAVMAKGSQGEDIYFGDSANNIDPYTPSGRQQIQFYTSGGRPLPNHVFANTIRQSPEISFVSTMVQRANKHRERPPSIQIDYKKVLSDNTIQLLGRWNDNDGSGPKVVIASLRCLAPMAGGSWTMFFSHLTVPTSLAGREQATLIKIWQSYRINNQVVAAMDQDIIRHIHALGALTSGTTKGSTTTTESGGGDEGSDPDEERQRQAQGFTNYLRDKTVIENTENGAHVTTGYDMADEFVRNSDHVQYVPVSGYIKGRDF